MKLQLLLVYLCVFSPLPSLGESAGLIWELKLSSEVIDQPTCERALGGFSKYCKLFSFVDPRLNINQRDWDRGGLEYAWFDFDGDGELDVYVRIRNFDWCGSLGCANFIIYNDTAQSSSEGEYPVTGMPISNDQIWIHFNENITVTYGQLEHPFDLADLKASETFNLHFE